MSSHGHLHHEMVFLSPTPVNMVVKVLDALAALAHENH